MTMLRTRSDSSIVYLYISETLWPGLYALILFGAYLIIVSNHQQNILINNPIFNHVGKWSY